MRKNHQDENALLSASPAPVTAQGEICPSVGASPGVT